MVYTISIESVWKVQAKPIIVIFVYCVSLWVIGVASHCISCSQHLVVVVSENTGTALAWNSNGRCQRLSYGGSSLESVGFTAM